MTFFERYTDLCEQRGIEPCSQRAADLFGTTRATISTWGKKKAFPRSETVVQIADALGVSTDYLLGRTEDPADYTDPTLPELEAENTDADVKAVQTQVVPADTDLDADCHRIADLYKRLDDIDRVRAEAYIEGILTGDKYKKKEARLA